MRAKHSDAPVLMATEICQWWPSHAWYCMNFWVAWQPKQPLCICIFFLNLFIIFLPFHSVMLSRFSSEDRTSLLMSMSRRKPPPHTLWHFVSRRSHGDGGRKPVAGKENSQQGNLPYVGTYARMRTHIHTNINM